jgi:UDP-N-acetylmuramate--alanine ligase
LKIVSNKFHFIGVGGIGMSGLAEVLFSLGAKVSGSDVKEGAMTTHLRNLGITIQIGHDEKNVGEPDVVVYSSAISKDNPEYKYALKNKIPLIRRAEALAELMRLRRGIAVAGTHGKTTTTSLVSSMLMEAGLDPTVVVGGVVKKLNSNVKWGQGDWLVAEADESDGSFDKLSPEIAIITNVDNDHLDFYGTYENLKLAYQNFAEKIPFYGRLIYCGDDNDLREMFLNYPKKSISYGFSEDCDYVLKSLGDSVYDVYFENKKIGDFKSSLPGRHNGLNSLAALIVGIDGLGLDFKTAAAGIESFEGVGRRFQIHPQNKVPITFIDDYAHHPTEVYHALQAVKERYPTQRIVTIFQPHRYSRVQSCWDQFLECFYQSDSLYITDIYPAGELPIEGVNTENLVNGIYKFINAKSSKEEAQENSSDLLKSTFEKKAEWVSGDLDVVLAKIQPSLRDNDVVIVLGAGSINQLTPRFYA